MLPIEGQRAEACRRSNVGGRDVDAMLCSMETSTPKSQAMRSHPLRVRLGMVTAMAIVIEVSVPERFRKLSGKWIPPEQRGTTIRFPASEKNSV
jgi:hypothetical protein